MNSPPAGGVSVDLALVLDVLPEDSDEPAGDGVLSPGILATRGCLSASPGQPAS